MTSRVDPFTRTPGIAGKAYIDNGIADEIITNFSSDESSKFVYKITGLRGSGKSVEYGKIIRTLKEDKKWLVYPLSASGDAIHTLISKLSMEKFIDSKKRATQVSQSASAGGNIFAVSGKGEMGITKSSTDNEHFYSDEATLTSMISTANKKNYKVLIGVDDISKTPEMIKLLSIVGSMILEGLKVYLVVTGLSDNIEDFSSEKNLSFFKRADSREIKALSKYDVTYKYEELLGVDTKKAQELQKLTGGYAYAYQVLGSLYFCKKANASVEDLLPEYERILFKDSYDLIWKSLTAGEKEVVRSIYKTKDGKVEDIRSLLSNPASFAVYRARLINKHLVDAETRGYLRIKLPRFDRFIELWGDDE